MRPNSNSSANVFSYVMIEPPLFATLLRRLEDR
jgi:hypothetical protein